MRAFPEHAALRQYALAVALVAVGFALRLALEPLFGESHTHTVFYPVVILAAYFLGARPAWLATLLSASIAYWCFARPQFQWKADFADIAPAVFFIFTAAVSIYFIDGMARALTQLGRAQARAEDLARSHAALFRELNERVTNHMQLVAALLQLQARDERDPKLAAAFGDASARTMIISRAHRQAAGENERLLDFDTFARQLLDIAVAARSGPPVRVEIEAHGAVLPLDQATSVAVVLLECLNAQLAAGSDGVVRVGLIGGAQNNLLRVNQPHDGGQPLNGGGAHRRVIEAMVEQLGGRLDYREAADQTLWELSFPRPGVTFATALPGPLAIENTTLH